MKPVTVYIYRSAESTAWSRSSIFSECPCFHRSVNLDQCQTLSTFVLKKYPPILY